MKGFKLGNIKKIYNNNWTRQEQVNGSYGNTSCFEITKVKVKKKKRFTQAISLLST